MSHQPFETWMLSEEPLSAEQEKALRQHLRTCETCYRLEASWTQVRRSMRGAPALQPAPGFSLRWQERLAEKRLRRQEKRAWLLFGLLSAGALLLFALICSQTLEILRSPEQIRVIWVMRALYLISLVGEAGAFLDSFYDLATSLVPLPVWIALFWTGSGLSLIWFVVYQSITSPRRVLA